MAVNKVEINGEVKLDLTGDTVTADTLAEGKTAHNAAGEVITGTMTSGSAAPTLQEKTVSPSTSQQTVTPDDGYDGLSSVTVSGIQTETGSATDNGTFSPASGKYYSQFTVNVAYTAYRTGGGGPYDSLGSDGDLYFDMG